MVNFTTVGCRISSWSKWYKNYKNRLRLAKVIVKNKMSRFLWFTVYKPTPYTILIHCLIRVHVAIARRHCVVGLYCICVIPLDHHVRWTSWYESPISNKYQFLDAVKLCVIKKTAQRSRLYVLGLRPIWLKLGAEICTQETETIMLSPDTRTLTH